MEKTVECKVSKIEDYAYKVDVDELLVREYPLTIFLNGKKLATLLCSPENLKALVVGFLRTEGLISTSSDILYFDLDEEKGIAEIEVKNKEVARESFFPRKLIWIT